MTDENYMLCMRSNIAVSLNSEKRQCCKCACEVWVSEASLRLADEKKAKFICFICVRDFRGKATVHWPTKEQIEEMRNAGRVQ